MRSFCTVLVSALLTAVGAVAADNWTQFHGPNGAGHSDATGLPTKWSEKENVVWKTAIHDKGHSSPVVWGDQVWLTTAREDGKAMFALCIDRNKGTVLHDIKLWDVEKPEFCIEYNSYASPTPVIEEGRVYVHFGTYGTACIDTANGKKLWERRDLKCDHFRGPGSSPILYGDQLILTFDGFDAQYVAALNKKTGETVWKKDRDIDYKVDNGDYKKAFSTPTVIKVKDKPQLISPAAVATIAYDPKTGDELWKVYHAGMNAAAPPLYVDGKVIIANGSGALIAVRPDGSGDVTKTHVEWKLNSGAPTRSAPIAIDDKLYLMSEATGVLTCLSLKDGSKQWTERIGGKFTPSPIYADGKLYLFSEEKNGKAVVGEVGKGWKELAENHLDDGCMGTPAVAGKALFVRTKTHLYRIEQKD
jgi:outer membrane protein assembly factor BamB